MPVKSKVSIVSVPPATIRNVSFQIFLFKFLSKVSVNTWPALKTHFSLIIEPPATLESGLWIYKRYSICYSAILQYIEAATERGISPVVLNTVHYARKELAKARPLS